MNTLQRQEVHSQIADRLNLLWAVVKSRSRGNLTKADYALEEIMAKVLNAMFGWQLKNLNATQANYPSADLGDKKLRLAFQITSQEGTGKITATRKAAIDHGLHKDFERLVIFFLLPKGPKLSASFEQPAKGPTIEVWDIVALTKAMSNGSVKDAALLEANEILREEIGLPTEQWSLGRDGFSQPRLKASFQLEKNTPIRIGKGKTPAYGMDLWIDGAPQATSLVIFELLDDSFNDNPWCMKRDTGTRDFLTEEMNSYGDVAIVVIGMIGKHAAWSIETTLYQALVLSHGKKPANAKIAKALQQIRAN